MTKGILAKVCMISLRAKVFNLLQQTLNSSATDSQNLIVDINELKFAISKLNSQENNELRRFLKDIIKTIPEEVNYIWFYL